MTLGRFWVLTATVLTATFALASIPEMALRITQRRQDDQARERGVWISALRQSRFADITHTSAHPSCAISDPPEALATPDPLLEIPDPKTRITVSFIVGTDGKVYSPLILEGASLPEDRTVLNTVRSWRYRPAKCNGVPTEAEGKIEFFSR